MRRCRARSRRWSACAPRACLCATSPTRRARPSAPCSPAFCALEGGAEFLALARNRSFQDPDGALSLDAGPFVTALKYTSGREATLFGKPSRALFEAALGSLGCPADQAVMVGDDVESDVAGAMAAGLTGVLLRCGKYRPGDEALVKPPPSAVLADLAAAVDWTLERARR